MSHKYLSIARKRQLPACALLLSCGCLALACHAQPPDAAPGPKIIERVSLEQAQALVGGPTLITLRFKEAAPRLVWEELLRQANISPLGADEWLWKQHEAPISVDMEARPLWEAVGELEEKSGLSLYFGSSRPEPFLAGAEQGAASFPGLMGPRSSSGSFRIVAGEITWMQLRSLFLTRRRAEEDARGDAAALATTSDWNTRTLSLQVLADPKFSFIRAAEASVDEAVDEKGHSLLTPITVQGVLWLAAPPTASINIARADAANATGAGEKPSRTIARLKGRVRLVFASRIEKWQAPAALNMAPLSHSIMTPEGGEDYFIPTIGKGPYGYAMSWTVKGTRVQAEWKPGQPRPLLRSEAQLMVLNSQLSLIDTEGKTHMAEASNSSGGIESHSETVNFSSPAEGGAWTPARLVWNIPVEWKEVEVPFEFTDLPLP